MKSFLVEIAREAGDLLLNYFDKGIDVAFKGTVDLVTEADRTVEDLVIGKIRQQFPDHDVLGEETGALKRGGTQRWVIDPLDGTTNFAHGFPWFAVSIGFEVRGEMMLGAIFNPCSGEFYLAERGGGATLNDRPIQVSTASQLDQSLLATGFPYDRKTTSVNNYDHFINFQQAARACRRPGAASLDLACVAAGRFDGFWEMKLKPWDVAAGMLLVEEAGGQVTDFDGLPMPLDRQECLASNGRIHAKMQAVLAQGQRPTV